jgi:hypothetical protein
MMSLIFDLFSKYSELEPFPTNGVADETTFKYNANFLYLLFNRKFLNFFLDKYKVVV